VDCEARALAEGEMEGGEFVGGRREADDWLKVPGTFWVVWLSYYGRE
jgi:hypothetical protein